MPADRRPWSQQELDTLDKLLGKVSAATIAMRLKRTETSVVMKIKATGHSRRLSEGYTIRDLEECLGEDHHKIHKWIANAWLRDGKQGIRPHNGNGHDIHRFREKDIVEFIKKCGAAHLLINVKLAEMWSWLPKVPQIAVSGVPNSTFLRA